TLWLGQLNPLGTASVPASIRSGIFPCCGSAYIAIPLAVHRLPSCLSGRVRRSTKVVTESGVLKMSTCATLLVSDWPSAAAGNAVETASRLRREIGTGVFSHRRHAPYPYPGRCCL